MIRILAAGICGCAVGLAIGPISMLMGDVSDTLMRGWPWPEMHSEYFRMLLLTSIPAAINGAIGAVIAAGFGSRRRLNITLLPALLHVAAAVLALIDDPRYYFFLYQLGALMFTVVMWPAGRLGQMIGWALRNRSPQAEASAAVKRSG